MFTSILTGTASSASAGAIAVCFAASLACGLICALTYRMCEYSSKRFLMTLAILPAIVQIIILMVNGNLGAGVAVAGSFSLVRFRSLPGKANDILMLFVVMGLGLCTGMGYVVFALLAAIALSLVYVIYTKTGLLQGDPLHRNLVITIPEDLDYTEIYTEIFAEYTKKAELESVRTANLGTMYQVTYEVELKSNEIEKKMIDEIRVRNGNLNVVCGKTPTIASEL